LRAEEAEKKAASNTESKTAAAATAVTGMMAMLRGQATSAETEKEEDMDAAVEAANMAKGALNAALLETQAALQKEKKRADNAEAKAHAAEERMKEQAAELNSVVSSIQSGFNEERKQFLERIDVQGQQAKEERDALTQNILDVSTQQGGIKQEQEVSHLKAREDLKLQHATQLTEMKEKTQQLAMQARQQLQGKEESLKALTVEVEQLRQTNQDLVAGREAIVQETSAKAEFLDTIKTLETRVTKLEASVTKEEELKTEALQKCASVESTMEAILSQNSEVLNGAEEDKENMKAMKALLETKTNETNSAMDAHKEKVAAYESQIAALNEDRASLDETLKNLKADHSQVILDLQSQQTVGLTEMKEKTQQLAMQAKQQLQQKDEALAETISQLEGQHESTCAQHSKDMADLDAKMQLMSASENKIKEDLKVLQTMAGQKADTDAAHANIQEEKDRLQRQILKLKEDAQKSTQRREKMLTEAVLAEREAWETQITTLKEDHTKQILMMEKMMSKVAPTPAPPVTVHVPQKSDDTSDVVLKLVEAEKLIDVQQSQLIEKEKEMTAMKSDPSGSVLFGLRERLEKSEKLVAMQRDMMKTKDEQLKAAIDSAMSGSGPQEVFSGPSSGSTSRTLPLDVQSLQQRVEQLTQEKDMVLEKAKQAVDELTNQLSKTRSAREKELERKATMCEEVINNLKQQAAIDLQVKNFLAERVQELEAPEGFPTELTHLQSQLTMVSVDKATLEEVSRHAEEQVKILQEQVRAVTKEKEDTMNQIQSWGVNAFISQQLQDLRDGLQAVHAERDDALEQLRSANHVKGELAAKLMAMGAETNLSETEQLCVPARIPSN